MRRIILSILLPLIVSAAPFRATADVESVVNGSSDRGDARVAAPRSHRSRLRAAVQPVCERSPRDRHRCARRNTGESGRSRHRAFRGKGGRSLFVSIDHDGGLQTTYSWVSEVDTRKGAKVQQGDVIALSGTGHPGSTEPTHLHFGVKQDGDYVDPMLYLGAIDVVDLIHLAPLAA